MKYAVKYDKEGGCFEVGFGKDILAESISYEDAKFIAKTLDRYEKLRKLNPRQFAELYDANLNTGKPFDELVDELE